MWFNLSIQYNYLDVKVRCESQVGHINAYKNYMHYNINNVALHHRYGDQV